MIDIVPASCFARKKENMNQTLLINCRDDDALAF